MALISLYIFKFSVHGGLSGISYLGTILFVSFFLSFFHFFAKVSFSSFFFSLLETRTHASSEYDAPGKGLSYFYV